MLTLKLYRNGPLPPNGFTVIIETVGLWISHCDNDVKHIQAFKKTVGVQDEDGTPEFYVGGRPGDAEPRAVGDPPPAIVRGAGGNYYDWAVLENAMGKTTEMFR